VASQSSNIASDSDAAAVPATPTQVGGNPLRGDTLELVSIGGTVLPDWRQGGLPCDAAGTPAFERLVFYDSSYFGIRVARPGCRDRSASSSDTVQWASAYRMYDDTLLRLYVGDGDEVEESLNGRLTPDSVIQIAVEAREAKRYVRRRGE